MKPARSYFGESELSECVSEALKRALSDISHETTYKIQRMIDEVHEEITLFPTDSQLKELAKTFLKTESLQSIENKCSNLAKENTDSIQKIIHRVNELEKENPKLRECITDIMEMKNKIEKNENEIVSTNQSLKLLEEKLEMKMKTLETSLQTLETNQSQTEANLRKSLEEELNKKIIQIKTEIKQNNGDHHTKEHNTHHKTKKIEHSNPNIIHAGFADKEETYDTHVAASDPTIATVKPAVLAEDYIDEDDGFVDEQDEMDTTSVGSHPTISIVKPSVFTADQFESITNFRNIDKTQQYIKDGKLITISETPEYKKWYETNTKKFRGSYTGK